MANKILVFPWCNNSHLDQRGRTKKKSSIHSHTRDISQESNFSASSLSFCFSISSTSYAQHQIERRNKWIERSPRSPLLRLPSPGPVPPHLLRGIALKNIVVSFNVLVLLTTNNSNNNNNEVEEEGKMLFSARHTITLIVTAAITTTTMF